MASFFQGVKNFFFGGSREDREDGEQQQASSSGRRESGHKRSRQQTRQPHKPVLQDVGYAGNGGVQGLGWYTSALQVDADGDAAHAFYQEQQSSSNNNSSNSSSHLQQVSGIKQASRHQCRLKGIRQGHVVIAAES